MGAGEGCGALFSKTGNAAKMVHAQPRSRAGGANPNHFHQEPYKATLRSPPPAATETTCRVAAQPPVFEKRSPRPSPDKSPFRSDRSRERQATDSMEVGFEPQTSDLNLLVMDHGRRYTQTTSWKTTALPKRRSSSSVLITPIPRARDVSSISCGRKRRRRYWSR